VAEGDAGGGGVVEEGDEEFAVGVGVGGGEGGDLILVVGEVEAVGALDGLEEGAVVGEEGAGVGDFGGAGFDGVEGEHVG